MYRLVFLTGKLKGRRLAVQQGSLLIGRDPECQLDLSDDDEVSRHHAVIEQRADGHYIKDLGAMNPTEINGRAVKEWKLKQNDKIEIGRTVLQFQLIEAAAATTVRRSSPLQLFAFLAMGLLLVAQVAYWFLFPIWQNRTAPSPTEPVRTAKVVATATNAPTELDSLQLELEQAMAQAEREQTALANLELASAVTTGAPEPELTQVTELRENVADLRKQMESITSATSALAAAVQPAPEATLPPPPKPAAIETNAIVDSAVPAPVATPVPAEDPILAKARDMLTEALVEQQKHNLPQADKLMERVQIMAPDFVPAYVERARLYESRGMLKKAGEQWTQVLNRSMGTPLYEQAAAERQRLARAEIILDMNKDTPATEASAAGTRMPRRIRIASVEREKFEASKDYDEMRIIRVVLKARVSEGDIDTDDFAAVLTFYDRGLESDKVEISRTVVPATPLTVEGLWRAGEQKSVTGAYIVSKGFRVEEEEETGERHAFEGVRIQVYYKDQLQDEEAVPKSLLALDSPPPPYVNEPVGR